MALTVEDGTGLASADSYISVAYANTYFANRGNAEWDVLDDTDDKEPALRRATDFMQAMYGQRWKGYRTTVVQALDWPRYNVPKPGYAEMGPLYAINELPVLVKNACAELALRTATSGESLVPDITRDDTAKSVKVGPLAIDYSEFGITATVYRQIEAMLAPLFVGSGGPMVQLVRT